MKEGNSSSLKQQIRYLNSLSNERMQLTNTRAPCLNDKVTLTSLVNEGSKSLIQTC